MINWYYIAGFFDGEGSITNNGKGYRVSISQTNESVLNDIKDFTKIGGVIVVTKRKEHWKQSWVYYVARQQDVYYFLDKIKDKIIVKKDLLLKVLEKLDRYLLNKEIRDQKRVDIKKEAKQLRKAGRTYREIGKELKIDFGYARRIILKN